MIIGGNIFVNSNLNLRGNNDVLKYTLPSVIEEIHNRYS
jgi:methionine synthase I (cobalamin-dependent)